MAKLIVLVGLPASGKSTYAKKIAGRCNATIISSDSIREKITGDVNNQNDNQLVFEEVFKQGRELLNSNKNVIIDATNINRKRRVHMINHELKAGVYEVHYMNTDVDRCKSNNLNRERIVPEFVIDNMYKSLHIPVKNEGWDKVFYINQENKFANLKKAHAIANSFIHSNSEHDSFFEDLVVVIPELLSIFNLPHDSTYHTFSVSRHTYLVYREVLENYCGNESDTNIMLWSSLLHDIGKAHTKSFIGNKGEEKRYASYIGHEFVGAQIAAHRLHCLGFDEYLVQDIVSLIQFHMYPMKAGKKKMGQVNNLLGDRLYSMLMFLHEADKKAK